ncbi:Aspartate/methionine/tyrosine aminotransferase [Dethiosulfatibacter aminovorans DSM 17477]|uniref:Aminotransferase n=1 Tax=Dethiosulfatibacter aminovorans DSM 17477 TaxID=1121476 RepID=A0A1M6EK14_9FIRM|nr:pyridoxal phosphate-dependent aminotransferase [Dethiosulfatibacter aminovorans]SHI85852.1 Aspartate/methionine/tyrosine aminotransferase [Dethiosulfatibacter aminovorans DSM 17477]
MKNLFMADRMDKLEGEAAFAVLAKARELEAKGMDIKHFEVGEPDFPTPMKIREAGKKAIDDGLTFYSPAQGYMPFREAIADYAKQYKNIDTDTSEIVVTPGGKSMIFFTLMCLVNPGDEVIYPDPGYPAYRSMIKYTGGIPVPVNIIEEKGYSFDLDELESKISDRTKLIIINSPGNPTGGVLPPEDIDRIAELIENKNIYVFSDEIYDRLIYEGTTKSIASIASVKDRVIVADSFSKSYAMTGWRLGYGIMNPVLAEEMTKLQINCNSCTSTFVQVAGIEALKGPQDEVDRMRGEFMKRRDLVVEGLNSIKGFSCMKTAGAFYAFANIKSTGLESSELASTILEESGVALLDGASFGDNGKGYLRLSYANSEENIMEALNRIDLLMGRIMKNRRAV